MTEPLDAWIDGLPQRARATLRRLSHKALDGEEVMLLKAIDRHEAAAERHLSTNEFLDVDKCRSLARLARALVHTLRSQGPDEQRIAVMAVHYFALVSDGDDDFDSPIGFDDDDDVLRSAAALCGLDELLEQP